jgi:hypothetical protein
VPARIETRTAGSTLLHLLREDGAERAEARGPAATADAISLALRQGVAPLLHQRLQGNGTLGSVAAPLAAQLVEARRATALDNLRKYGEFRRVARALGEAGIPLIALKGLNLAELVYRDISLRPMSDLDILVPRDRVAECIALLRKLDYGHDEDLGAAAVAMLGTKCNLGLAYAKLDIWLEVHWSLDERHGEATDPVPDVWKSALPARLGDADTQVMSPEFLLLHVCAHLACNHSFAFSLRALCDIAEIVRMHPALDWAAVVEHGSRHHWKRGIAAALRLARDHLGVPVPVTSLAALGGDALGPAMLAEALAQILCATSLPEGLVTAPNLLAISATGSPGEKAALLWRRVFLPRGELALLYGVPADSSRLPLYYALRLRDLLRRYAAGVWALIAGDPAVAKTAARHARLQRWIAGK